MDSSSKIELPNQEALLAEISSYLGKLNQKLDSLMEVNKRILKANEDLIQIVTDKDFEEKNKINARDPDAMALLSLPMALRKTVMALYQIDKATAEEIAKETGRLRAVESAAANQLVRMGYLKKCREGRDVYFCLNSTEEDR
jgi:DNA-binding MarR family transcriptional regulator